MAPVTRATREADRRAFMPNRRIPKTITEKRDKEIHIIDISVGRSMQGEARKRGREREQYKEKKRENEKPRKILIISYTYICKLYRSLVPRREVLRDNKRNINIL